MSLISVTFLFTLFLFTNCQWDSDRLRVVDQKNQNYYVRGNLPIVNNTFRFDLLQQKLYKLTNSTSSKIIVISLLNFLTAKQTKSRYIQQSFFNHKNQFTDKNNITHSYISHVVVGSYFSPLEYPQIIRSFATSLYSYTSYDKMPNLLSQIQQYLSSPTPTIVYVHCSQGIDRAGYVAASYKMKNMNKQLKQVVHQNLNIMAGIRKHIHFNAWNGMQWYCLHLGRNQQQCMVNEKDGNKISDVQL